MHSSSMQAIITNEIEKIVVSHLTFFSKNFMLNDKVLNARRGVKSEIYCTFFAGLRAILLWENLGGNVFFDFYWPKTKSKHAAVFIEMYEKFCKKINICTGKVFS